MSGRRSVYIMNRNSGDDRLVGMAHKVKSPKNHPQFSKTTMGQYWLGPNKFSDLSEMLSKSCHGFLKIFYFIQFSTD